MLYIIAISMTLLTQLLSHVNLAAADVAAAASASAIAATNNI